MRKIGGLLLALAICPGVVDAQQDVAVPAMLTLADALRLARHRNPSYQQALNSRDAAAVGVRAGWGAFLPSLSANMSFGAVSSRTVTGQDPFGQAVTNPTPIDFHSSSASQSLSTSLVLFDGLGTFNRLHAARASAAAADANVQLAAQSLDAAVSRAFYVALHDARTVTIDEGVLASARERLQNTQRLFSTGAETQEDVLGAQADVADRELGLEFARGQAQKSRRDLTLTIGIIEDIAFDVLGALPEPFDPATLNETALVTLANRSPAIAQLDASAQSAEANAGATRGQRLPSITANGAYGRSLSLSSYEALTELNPQNRSLSFSLAVNLPLFRGFGPSQQIASADAFARNAGESLRQGRMRVEHDLRNALTDLRYAYRALQLARTKADLSRQRVTLAKEHWRAGALSFINLQQIIVAAEAADQQLIDQQYSYTYAVVALELVVGRPVRP